MPLNHTSQFAELTDDQFKLIGKVVVEWSNLEYLLGVLLTRLLLAPSFPARSFTDMLTSAKRQEAVEEGIRLHKYRYHHTIIDEKTLNDISSINSRINELRARRNKIAHFCWTRSSDDEIFGTNFSGGPAIGKKHNRSHAKFTLGELSEVYKLSHAAVIELQTIVANLPENNEDDLVVRLARIPKDD